MHHAFPPTSPPINQTEQTVSAMPPPYLPSPINHAEQAVILRHALPLTSPLPSIMLSRQYALPSPLPSIMLSRQYAPLRCLLFRGQEIQRHYSVHSFTTPQSSIQGCKFGDSQSMRLSLTYFVLEAEVGETADTREHELCHIRNPCECVLHHQCHNAESAQHYDYPIPVATP